MITSARIADTPPFTAPVEFVFDEQVNLFIGPNASGKSTILRKLVRDYVSKPWVFIPSSHLNIPHSSKTHDWLSELSYDVPSESVELLRLNVHPHTFDGKFVYLATEALYHELLSERGDASKFDNVLKSKVLPYKCAQDICRDVLLENGQRDYIQRSPYPAPFESDVVTTSVPRDAEPDMEETFVHYGMGVGTVDVKGKEDAMLFVGDLSSGTQSTLLWIWYLAIRLGLHYDFCDGWEENPAVLLIDEIENHLHPTWQRRVIPALRKHFPGLQIFATTHSPFVVAGLKAGQVHLLRRDENGVVSASTHDEDIVGWTIEQILHSVMGVNALTDEETANKAARLQELQRKDALDGLSEGEAAEMEDLRANVSRDILAGGALNAQRNRYDDMMREFLKSRLSETAQDKASD